MDRQPRHGDAVADDGIERELLQLGLSPMTADVIFPICAACKADPMLRTTAGSILAQDNATIAEILKENGYATVSTLIQN
jgi:arylsulfatase A-like enzyme